MADRPNFVDFSPADHSTPPTQSVFTTPNGDAAPPRAGDIPPALSPLDAFAFQSRLLAKRFEEEDRNGKRLSRLPPLTVANELAKTRPTFYKADSEDGVEISPIQEEDATPRSAKEVKQEQRPRSHYPVIQSENGETSGAGRSVPFQSALSCVSENDHDSGADLDCFTIPRSTSPEPIEHKTPAWTVRKLSGSTSSPPNGPASTSLKVPSSPKPGRSLDASPNISSVLAGGTEDIENLSLADSFDLPMQRPASPYRIAPILPRSPSLASERSVGSGSLPRPSFNYSRPLSRGRVPSFDVKPPFSSPYRQDSVNSSSTRPSLEVPSRQNTGDSPITPFSNDVPHTPVSITSDDYFPVDDPQSNFASSYTYSKYSLPRGKAPKRESIGVEGFFNQIINWDNQLTPEHENVFQINAFDSPLPSVAHVPEESPASPPKTSSSARSRRKERPANIVIPQRSFSAEQSSPRRRLHKQRPGSPSVRSKTTQSSSNASTIKTSLTTTKSAAATDMTLEQRLQTAIELHEAGSLQESTYHLRLAARGGHPTAMLLYALACRHGWGMKPNQAEGVSWLQRAVDSAQLEVAEDEDLVQRGDIATVGPAERRTHKAQFALSVYELGVSYMNGWGVTQDRALGLRCFEVAGNWGDADALAEAGFCYAEGLGCKKDLKKAAKFYRAAEKKGMSMAGNSWIYKDKYMDDMDDDHFGRLSRKGTDEKKRSKSRPRFFARKKSTAS